MELIYDKIESILKTVPWLISVFFLKHFLNRSEKKRDERDKKIDDLEKQVNLLYLRVSILHTTTDQEYDKPALKE